MNLPWKVYDPVPSPLAESLARAFDLHPIVASILERRGIESTEAAERFLHPNLNALHDPFLLRGMDEAVDEVAGAIQDDRRIVISGDYDVDGITSSAMLWEFLRAAGCGDVEVFIPNRFHHGYGLTSRTADALLERNPDPTRDVRWGRPTTAEMMFGWMRYTHVEARRIVVGGDSSGTD